MTPHLRAWLSMTEPQRRAWSRLPEPERRRAIDDAAWRLEVDAQERLQGRPPYGSYHPAET